MAEALATPRYLGVLIAMFSGTALVLSLVGIYGVMAYFVQQHTRDIGIRLAIGGDPAQVRRMVVLQGVRLVVVGIGAGVAAALLAGRLMSTVLFGVSPTDPRALSACRWRCWPWRSSRASSRPSARPPSIQLRCCGTFEPVERIARRV